MKIILHLVFLLTTTVLWVNCQAVNETTQVYESLAENDTLCELDGEVRLVGLSTRSAGRVEVCQDGYWGTVCSKQWSLKNAQVVCQSLGYHTAVTAIPLDGITESVRAEPSVDIYMTNVMCDGTEDDIRRCSHSTDTSHCSHFNDVAVVCAANPEMVGEVRLVGDTEDYRGAVEYYDARLGWTGICADSDHVSSWTDKIAEVACSQLGYEGGRAFTKRAEFIERILVGDMMCDDSAQSLGDCHRSPLLNGECTTQDVGWIECQLTDQEDYSVRLAPGSRDGLVEVAINGRWGTVCGDSSWTQANAEVVCNQLGIESSAQPTVVSGTSYVQYMSSQKPIWLSRIVCIAGVDESLKYCGKNFLLGYSVDCSSPTNQHTSAAVNCDPALISESMAAGVSGLLGFLAWFLCCFCCIPCSIWACCNVDKHYKEMKSSSCCKKLKTRCKSGHRTLRERLRRRHHPGVTPTVTATDSNSTPTASNNESNNNEILEIPAETEEPEAIIVRSSEDNLGQESGGNDDEPPSYERSKYYAAFDGISKTSRL